MLQEEEIINIFIKHFPTILVTGYILSILIYLFFQRKFKWPAHLHMYICSKLISIYLKQSGIIIWRRFEEFAIESTSGVGKVLLEVRCANSKEHANFGQRMRIRSFSSRVQYGTAIIHHVERKNIDMWTACIEVAHVSHATSERNRETTFDNNCTVYTAFVSLLCYV